jgi:hypothetical protein
LNFSADDTGSVLDGFGAGFNGWIHDCCHDVISFCALDGLQ